MFISKTPLTNFQKFWANVIKCGPIPKHVAFIMDGNRRYASKKNIDKREAHICGLQKLREIVNWCLEFGITEVTVYGFSIENFNRSKDEVDILKNLAENQALTSLTGKDGVLSNDIRIKVIGNFALLPQTSRRLFSEIMLLTKDNRRATLNIAWAYTSREEIMQTVKTVVEGVDKGLINVDDISEDLISECLYTSESPDPDMIVRTSGEVRFSDFLLWQISSSYVYFSKVLWPELSFWHLLACVFKYQRVREGLEKHHSVEKVKNERSEKFVAELRQKRLAQLQSYLS